MKNNGLVYTQVTYELGLLLRKIREELESIESTKKRNRKKITKREICEELVKRCKIKGVI